MRVSERVRYPWLYRCCGAGLAIFVPSYCSGTLSRNIWPGVTAIFKQHLPKQPHRITLLRPFGVLEIAAPFAPASSVQVSLSYFDRAVIAVLSYLSLSKELLGVIVI